MIDIDDKSTFMGQLFALAGTFLSLVLVYADKKLKRTVTELKEKTATPSKRRLRLSPPLVCWSFAALSLVFLLAVTLNQWLPGPKSSAENPNEQFTEQAWWAFDKGQYKRAIANADECISAFKPEADKQQKELTLSNVPPSAIDGLSEQDKQVVLKRGTLNDVATCFFIKGRALEKNKRYNEAKRAYLVVTNYPHARALQKNLTSFWSPSEVALGRLDTLPRN